MIKSRRMGLAAYVARMEASIDGKNQTVRKEDTRKTKT
jgi:hypothetical protein